MRYRLSRNLFFSRKKNEKENSKPEENIQVSSFQQELTEWLLSEEKEELSEKEKEILFGSRSVEIRATRSEEEFEILKEQGEAKNSRYFSEILCFRLSYWYENFFEYEAKELLSSGKVPWLSQKYQNDDSFVNAYNRVKRIFFRECLVRGTLYSDRDVKVLERKVLRKIFVPRSKQ